MTLALQILGSDVFRSFLRRQELRQQCGTLLSDSSMTLHVRIRQSKTNPAVSLQLPIFRTKAAIPARPRHSPCVCPGLCPHLCLGFIP